MKNKISATSLLLLFLIFASNLVKATAKPTYNVAFAKHSATKKIAGPAYPVDTSETKQSEYKQLMQPFKGFYKNLDAQQQKRIKRTANKAFKKFKPNKKNDSSESELNILSLLSMIFGILALLGMLILALVTPPVSVLVIFLTGIGLGIVGLILGIIGIITASKKGQRGKGFAIAGIVTSGVGILISLIGLIVIASIEACNAASNSSNNSQNDCCCNC